MIFSSALPVDPYSGIESPAMHANIIHHGALHGVTGSCHQLFIDDTHSLLIDCGLFQGAETSPDGGSASDRLEIPGPARSSTE